MGIQGRYSLDGFSEGDVTKPSFSKILVTQIDSEAAKGYRTAFVVVTALLILCYLFVVGIRGKNHADNVLAQASKEIGITDSLSSGFSNQLRTLCELMSCNEILVVSSKNNQILSSFPADAKGSYALGTESFDSGKSFLIDTKQMVVAFRNDVVTVFTTITWLSLLRFPLIIFMLIAASALGFLVASRRVAKRVSKILGKEISTLTEAAVREPTKMNENSFTTLEGEQLFEFITDQKKRIGALATIEAENEKNKVISDIAAQLAHDIRSPLAAIRAISGVDTLSPSELNLLDAASNRIAGICDQLLQKYLGQEVTGSETICLIADIVEKIISEKKRLWESDKVEIKTQIDKSARKAILSIDSVEISRVLSNLLNNAFESLTGEIREISVRIKMATDRGDAIEISVADNGRGIPEHILPTLSQKTVTHGKEGGTGLGLYHARAAIEKARGSFSIESQVNKGTLVKLILPVAATPTWLATEIPFGEQVKKYIVVDDCPAIYELWKTILDKEITYFEKVDILALQELAKEDGTIFLLDQRISDKKFLGTDLIEKLGISKKSILVTSDFNEPSLHHKAQSHGFLILPKPLIEHIQIPCENGKGNTQRPDLVLIDDDIYVREAWALEAKRGHKELFVFGCAQEVVDSHIDPSIPIYVDLRLGEKSGLDEVHELHERGFLNLHIATGDLRPRDYPNYVKSVRGKEFPA